MGFMAMMAMLEQVAVIYGLRIGLGESPARVPTVAYADKRERGRVFGSPIQA
jgi:hypothetical protein